MIKSNRSLFSRAFRKIQHKHVRRITTDKIKDLPQGYELFSFPISPYRVEKHPVVQEADVIVLHWIAGFINYPTFFKAVKKPILWRLPDLFPFSGGNHYERGFPFKAYEKILTKNIEIKKESLKNTDLHLIPLCHWMSDQLEKSIFSHFPKTIIPNGLDTNIFKPRNRKFSRDFFGLPEDKFILLFVSDSVMNQRKGLSLLQRAFDELKNPNIHLGLLGSHSESINLPKSRYTSLGKINDERLMSLAYSASDLFVIPSIEDNLPNTVIESISCGTPVIGFHIGGIPDMINPMKNGFLCNEISPTALASTIEKAIDFKFDREQIRKDALNRFDQSIQAEKYIRLLHSVLS
jgi:glycosyltransferase involved in cell wall biosynthesis